MERPGARRPVDRVVRVTRPRRDVVVLRRPAGRRPHPSSPYLLILGLLALIAVGTGLLLLPVASEPPHRTDLLTALFTATSAASVTGLVVVDTQTHWSLFGELVVLVLIFTGGLGFLTSSTLILLVIGRQLSLRDRLVLRESSGEGTLGSVAALVRRIVRFALLVQLVGAVLLTFYWLVLEQERPLIALWYGIFHAVSAFNNAGFDLLGGFRGLTGHADQPYLLLVASALIIIGSLGYAPLADLWRQRRFQRLALDSKLVLTLSGGLLAIGTVMFFVLEHGNPATLGALDLPARLVHAFFFSASGRTAGFASLDVSALRDETLFFLMGLMFVGGAAGSTAGGIKVNVLAVLTAALVSASKGRLTIVAYQREIPPAVVMRALTVAMLSLVILVNVALVLTIAATFEFVVLLFEATSAVATNGLSTGVTPAFTGSGKLTLIVAMFLGRLGPLTLAFVLARRQRASRLRYGEDAVRIG